MVCTLEPVGFVISHNSLIYNKTFFFSLILLDVFEGTHFSFYSCVDCGKAQENSKPCVWRHLAAVARAADPLHAVALQFGLLPLDGTKVWVWDSNFHLLERTRNENVKFHGSHQDLNYYVQR